MFQAGKDFLVEDDYGIIRCLPQTDEARAAFKVLQMRLGKLVAQLPDAPKAEIPIDGVIGPSATLAMQLIALRLAEGSHQDLAAFAIAQPEEAIPMCAASAMEMAGYLDSVMEQDPHALAAPTEPTQPQIDLWQYVKSI